MLLDEIYYFYLEWTQGEIFWNSSVLLQSVSGISCKRQVGLMWCGRAKHRPPDYSWLELANVNDKTLPICLLLRPACVYSFVKSKLCPLGTYQLNMHRNVFTTLPKVQWTLKFMRLCPFLQTTKILRSPVIQVRKWAKQLIRLTTEQKWRIGGSISPHIH